ncbi:Alpha-1,3-rhamnosyl/mannosyltransferase [Candidatus Desulfarcum epimagneticum]|uniref:Alpha-1,3-rhamnosyl/mannosyltransferase n=1 Tax=uncultured Desulfobacteraceae bacterium TaxID=218296 RepID=A0A484HI41_9BACT|nr:Alpha-1,3-rhamnosyl/mannosyltransferase [uncultured Desulfobacteraceae bacterium]
MKILVNANPMAGILTGISRYLRNLYAALSDLDQGRIFYMWGNEVLGAMPPLADFARWEKMTATVWKLADPIVFGLRSLHLLRQERKLREICRNTFFDIYHETGFTPSKMTSSPTLYTMCDLSMRRYKETHPRERVLFFEYFLKRRFKYANHILTISEYIRQEIINELNVPPEMVSFVHLAADPVFGPVSAEKVKKVRDNYGLPESYLLFVSSLEPRKNIDLLMDALRAAKTDIPVVLAGWHAWGDKEWIKKAEMMKKTNPVYVLGHIPDHDLVALYNGAVALIYPSIYEGFGLPIVEAMSCGCPVICSNRSSMPEVAGDAAILIDPFDSEDLAQAIEQVSHDTRLRRNLARLGLNQAKRFSWEKSAAETLDVFKKVAKNK